MAKTGTTNTPDPPAPALYCPRCARPLIYRRTAFGGIKPEERWDYYECVDCGRFRYRHRTRKLVESD